MAFQVRAWWVVSMTWKDDDGAMSRTTIPCYEPGVDVGFPVIELYAAQLVARAKALSDAALLDYSITRQYYEADSGEKIPTPGSDVEDKGVFLLETSDAAKGSISIPSILESKLVDTGPLAGIQIDATDADVASFIEYLTTDIDTTPLGLAGEVHAVDSRGFEYELVYDAYKQNRASQKSRGRKG